MPETGDLGAGFTAPTTGTTGAAASPGISSVTGAITPANDPLASLYAQYFTGPNQTAPTAAAPGTSNVQDFLTSAENQFIPEMLSTNYRQTPAGSAAYQSAADPINAKFDQLKEQILNNAAMQGVAPGSGIVQDQLDSAEAQRTEALSGLEQQFNAQLPQRQEQGISQLTNLMGLNQQQQLQSLGIQQSLDEAERQRILDAATLAGNQGAAAAENAASNAGNLLNAASSLSGAYYNRGAQQAQGLGAMTNALGNYFNQPSQAYQTDAAMYNQYGGNVNNDPYYTNLTTTYGPQVDPYSSFTPGTAGYTGPAAGQ